MLAFGKYSDCCLFIFYQAILLSFLINSEIFSNNYLGISRHIITSFEISINVLPPSIVILALSAVFYCSHKKSRHSFVPDVNRNTSCILLLTMM